LWPAFILMAYFILALAAFAVLDRDRELSDAEVEARPDSRMLGRFLRNYIMWVLSPWQRALVASGVTPNMLTAASLAAAAGSACAVAVGRFSVGGWLYLLCGILDILDGRVARVTHRVSPSGAFFDSVIDRYAELIVFGGLCFYYRGSFALGVVLAASLGSVMVSYTRARGESLGVTDLNIGMMQRPERLFYLGMAMIWAPIVEALLGHGALPPHALVLAGLLLLAVSANVTAIRRIRHTMARLEGRAGRPSEPRELRDEGRRVAPLVALPQRRAS
jgi:phosphatidylglycerophosphate synthase